MNQLSKLPLKPRVLCSNVLKKLQLHHKKKSNFSLDDECEKLKIAPFEIYKVGSSSSKSHVYEKIVSYVK